MIKSFGDKATEDFFKGLKTARSRQIPTNIAGVVRRKLDQIEQARKLDDLRAPPHNFLKALKADLVGYHAIRINDQFRIVFRWVNGGAEEVRVTDYH